MNVSIKTACFKLRKSLSEGDAFGVKEALNTAVNKASSPQLVTELVVENNSDQLAVKAGEKLSATCIFTKDVAPVTFALNKYDKHDSNSGAGDANDEGYVCDVTMTGAIGLGGTSSDKLKFVWLKGRAGKSGKEKSKSQKEAAPGYSWFYKERTWGTWTAWKGSSAAFSPSFTGFSASVTGCSIGVTGLSVTMEGIEIKLMVFLYKKWVVSYGMAMTELQMKGASLGAKISTVANYCLNTKHRMAMMKACGSDRE